MIHLGFTGTRRGMTHVQRQAVCGLVEALARKHQLCAHHGDCVGADAEFHQIALAEGARLVIHPPVDESLRAFCKPADEWRAPLTHLARNRAIVVEAEHMIGAPAEGQWQPRGGTWYTLDRARRVGKSLAIAFPNGALIIDAPPWPGR